MANRLGPHRLWFDIEHGNQKTKASLVSFDVIVPQREMDNPSRDDDILQSVWEESGATAAATEAAAPRDKFFHLWELPVVASSIPDRKRILSGVDATYRLWDTWLVFLLLTGLLCVEWIVRKLTRLP